jgi:hypothetical protein
LIAQAPRPKLSGLRAGNRGDRNMAVYIVAQITIHDREEAVIVEGYTGD